MKEAPATAASINRKKKQIRHFVLNSKMALFRN